MAAAAGGGAVIYPANWVALQAARHGRPDNVTASSPKQRNKIVHKAEVTGLKPVCRGHTARLVVAAFS